METIFSAAQEPSKPLILEPLDNKIVKAVDYVQSRGFVLAQTAETPCSASVLRREFKPSHPSLSFVRFKASAYLLRKKVVLANTQQLALYKHCILTGQRM